MGAQEIEHVVETAPKNEPPPVDLKDPALAALLAWLVPGLGHWYQRRRAKAVLFFVCIMGLFVFGLRLGGTGEVFQSRYGPVKIGYGRAVYFSWRPDDRRWHYFCQFGIGLPALPALIQANRMANRQPILWNGFMAPPWSCEAAREAAARGDGPNLDQPTPHEINLLIGREFELAGVFTMIAGLLNILAIYDAYAGPVPLPSPEKKGEEGEEKSGKKRD